MPCSRRRNGHRFLGLFADLDGCVATGATREEVEREMQEAIVFHLEAMQADGLAAPSPHTYAAYVDA